MLTNIKLLYCWFICFFVLCVIVRIKPRSVTCEASAPPPSDVPSLPFRVRHTYF